MVTRTQQTCLLCGEPLKQRAWWWRLLGMEFPTHDPDGAEGDACWVAFNLKIGIDNPGPKPKGR